MNATIKQIDFLARLATERDVMPGYTPEAAVNHLRQQASIGAIDKRRASAMIDAAMKAPRRPITGPTAAPQAAEGYYVKGDEAFKVQANKAGTSTYALRFTVTRTECRGH